MSDTGEPRRQDPLPFVLLVLTAVTGMIDAVSFLGLGRIFTANMTGNVVLLAFAVAGAPGLSIARSAVSLVAFLIGAMLGGRLDFAMAGPNRRSWLLIAGTGEALLLLAAALASRGLPGGLEVPPKGLYAVIVLTAVAMGLRNATVRRLAVPELTTTVLTLTLTGIASESVLAGGTNPWVSRRVAAVVCMFAGAAVGALLLRKGLAVPLAVSAMWVLVVTIAYALYRRSGRRWYAPGQRGSALIPELMNESLRRSDLS